MQPNSIVSFSFVTQQQKSVESPSEPLVTIAEVNRVLELGRLLLSVLTPEELDQLQQILSCQTIGGLFTIPLISASDSEIGNTSVT